MRSILASGAIFVTSLFPGYACAAGPSLDETLSAIRDIYVSCPIKFDQIQAVDNYFGIKRDVTTNVYTSTSSDFTYLDGSLTFTMDFDVNDVYIHIDSSAHASVEFNIADIDPQSFEFKDHDYGSSSAPKLIVKCSGDRACFSSEGSEGGRRPRSVTGLVVCDSTHADRLTKALQHLYEISPKAKPPAF